MRTRICTSMRVAALLLLALLVGGVGLRGPATADEPKSDEAKQAEEKAVAAADAWLKLIDAGKYADGWDAAAEYLRNAVGMEQFVKALDAAVKPLGKLEERKVKSTQYRTSLPGARTASTWSSSTTAHSPTRSRPSRPSRPCSTRTANGACRVTLSSEAPTVRVSFPFDGV